MSQNPFLSLIIPLHNEADNILKLHRQIIDALKNIDYEIIYVDDGSQDETLSYLKQIQTPISILKMSKRNGQSAALLAGIHQSKSPYIATIDGDLQNDPKDIPRLLKHIQFFSADMVIGHRTIRHDSLMKKLPSKIINFILKNILNLPFSDMGCGLKIMTRKLALSVPLHRGMHRFLALNAHRNGAQIIELKVNHRPRVYGTSKYNLNRIPKVIDDLFFIYFELEKPQNRSRKIWNIGLIFFSTIVFLTLAYNTKLYMSGQVFFVVYSIVFLISALVIFLILCILKESILKDLSNVNAKSLTEYSFKLIK